MSFKVCVFLSSRGESQEQFVFAARSLGKALAQAGYHVIYGGTSIGLMGIFADAVRKARGQISGIILKRFQDEGILDQHLDETIVVDTLGERKSLMYQEAEAFIALPGGYGTLDEIAEVMVLNALSDSEKPVMLYNINGFYDDLMSFCSNLYKNKLTQPAEYAGPKLHKCTETIMSTLDLLKNRDGR